MVSYRRIYDTTVKKLGLVGIPLIFGMFYLMVLRGDITVTSYSGDSTCGGTIEDPCFAYINFTANLDIFVYPGEWEFYTDSPMKEIRMYRSWGTGWRYINLSRSCTGTWCGLRNKDDVRKFSYVFRRGRNYQLKFVGYKHNPQDDVYWGFGDIE